MRKASAKTTKTMDEICHRLAQGEPLRKICRDNHIPGWVAIYEWINADPIFKERIARARDIGFDAIAEEALAIADTPLEGVKVEEEDIPIKDDNGGVIGMQLKTKKTRDDMLGHRKLQIETRLKLLAKWSPRYRDSQNIALNGKLSTSDMTEEEMREELAQLTAANQAANAIPK